MCGITGIVCREPDAHAEGAIAIAGRELPAELAPTTGRLARKRGYSTPLPSWFDSTHGLLADHSMWTQPLLDAPELSPSAVVEALGRVGAKALARRRSAFYALAKWLDKRRRAVAAVA
jgi:hypothetical protein